VEPETEEEPTPTPTPPPAPASIGDFVWNDTDQDGIQDDPEPGVPEVAVELYVSDDTLAASTTTDEDGSYLFTNVAPGDYYVKFILPSGYLFSPQDEGDDDSVESDADPTTGETTLITLDPGQTDLTSDAGMYQLEIVWLLEFPDETDDVINYHTGEPAGPAGAELDIIAVRIGRFLFPEISPTGGSHVVELQFPNESKQGMHIQMTSSSPGHAAPARRRLGHHGGNHYTVVISDPEFPPAPLPPECGPFDTTGNFVISAISPLSPTLTLEMDVRVYDDAERGWTVIQPPPWVRAWVEGNKVTILWDATGYEPLETTTFAVSAWNGSYYDQFGLDPDRRHPMLPLPGCETDHECLPGMHCCDDAKCHDCCYDMHCDQGENCEDYECVEAKPEEPPRPPGHVKIVVSGEPYVNYYGGLLLDPAVSADQITTWVCFNPDGGTILHGLFRFLPEVTADGEGQATIYVDEVGSWMIVGSLLWDGEVITGLRLGRKTIVTKEMLDGDTLIGDSVERIDCTPGSDELN
ncbi:MAG: SdrD B-like domain-containing protein, partial [Anaerolineae bacterium]